MMEPELGVVAVSRAGHDKGKAFFIIGRADTEHVFLVDGDSRKLDRPKKKKLKHLHIESVKDAQVAERLSKGEKLPDAEIRKALQTLGYRSDMNQ